MKPAEIIEQTIRQQHIENKLDVFFTVLSDLIIADLRAAGYKIMPLEPTEEMWDAYFTAPADDSLRYRAMWDAAP